LKKSYLKEGDLSFDDFFARKKITDFYKGKISGFQALKMVVI
jgi:hypothetical protein